MERRSYSQSLVASLTCLTMLPGVMVGPEGKRRGSFWPDASVLTLVPPTSITRILGDLADGLGFIEAPWNCGNARRYMRRAEPGKNVACQRGNVNGGQGSGRNKGSCRLDGVVPSYDQ